MRDVGRPFLTCFRDFWVDQRGASMPLFAISLVAVVGAAAIGVDYARAVTLRQFLSNSADAAALAAVSRLPDTAAARAIALEYVEKNMPEPYSGVLDPNDVEMGTWDSTTRLFTPLTDGSAVATAVRVTTRLAEDRGNQLATLFATVLGESSMDISARATAGRGGPPCVMALDPTAGAALALGGSAALQAQGCGVQVNSTASPALEMGGGSSLEASNVCVGGTADTNGNAVSPDPSEFCPGQSDPLAALSPPIYGGCNHYDSSYHNSTATLQPGVYCGGLEIDGTSDVTLLAGTFIIKDGPLALKGSAKLSGAGVTLFLTGPGAVVSFKAKTQLDLAAPTDGELTGVLIFQDRDYGGTHDWKGKAAAMLQGVVYLPEGTLVSKNQNYITPETSCTVLIARTLAFEANGGASIDVSSADCRGGLPGPYRRGIVLLD